MAACHNRLCEGDYADFFEGVSEESLSGFSCRVVDGGGMVDTAGMRMFVLQERQRTVLPRADWGTAKTFLQVRFGHMIRTDCGFEAINPRV